MTLHGLDVAEFRGLYVFAFINVLLGNVLAGSVFTGLQQFVDQPGTIASTLGTAIPNVATLFITFGASVVTTTTA
jgi:hypothetical protein